MITDTEWQEFIALHFTPLEELGLECMAGLYEL